MRFSMISACVAGLLWASTAPVQAAFIGYDPYGSESPADVSSNWSLISGTSPITSVDAGFANTTLVVGNGLWMYDDAGLNRTVGWTVDARFSIAAANSPSWRAVGLLIREPGGGQIEVQITKGGFFLSGEGVGGIGSSASSPVAFDFTDDFHTLRVTRLNNNVRVYIDDNASAYINAAFSGSQTFGGNRVMFGRIGGDNRGSASIDFIRWDGGQSLQYAPGNEAGNNVPEPTALAVIALASLTLLRRRRS